MNTKLTFWQNFEKIIENRNYKSKNDFKNIYLQVFILTNRKMTLKLKDIDIINRI